VSEGELGPRRAAGRGARALVAAARPVVLVLLGLPSFLGACAQAPRSEEPEAGAQASEAGASGAATSSSAASELVPAAAPSSRPLVESIDLAGDVAEAIAPGDYVLAVGDVVRVVVVGQPDLSGELPVPPNGAIELPVVGGLTLLGRTAQDVSQEILTRLQDASFLVDAQISVTVTKLAPRQVFVVEGVERPEAYDIPAGATLHLTQVIALAGGLSKGADPSQVTILRRPPNQKPQLLRADLRAILDQERMDADPRLEPDDTVIVRDMKQGEEQVFVTGRVRTPGAYRFSSREGLTFLQSIVLAGGLDKYAKPGGAALLRRTDGGRKTIHVDLERILGGELELDVALSAGDVVFVPESFF